MFSLTTVLPQLLGLIKTAAEGGLAVSRRWFLLHGNSIHLSAKGEISFFSW
jgi:hypothetical protein